MADTKPKVYEGVVNKKFTVGSSKKTRKEYVVGDKFVAKNEKSFKQLINSRKIKAS